MTDQNDLLKLRQEILSQNPPANLAPQKSLAWGSRLVTALLVVLTLVSWVQVVQSAAVLEKIKSGSGSLAPAASPTGNSALPANLQNLPNMVGGC